MGLIMRFSICLLLFPLLLSAESLPYQRGSSWKGVWLRNTELEAFVSTQPRIRLLHLSRPGKPNLLRDREDDVSGVKTAFREPAHHSLSFAVCDQPGQILRQTEDALWVESPVHAEAELAIRMQIQLLKEEQALHITHQLINHAERERQLALWSLTAVPHQGRVDIPFPPGSHLKVLEGSLPNMNNGRVQVDFDQTRAPYLSNLSIRSPIPQWLLVQQTRSLHSSTADSNAEANLIVYQDDSPTEEFAELEHVGPLRAVPPGGSLSLLQKLSLHPVEALPNAQPNVLVFDRKRGPWRAPDGSLQRWEGRFGPQSVFLGESGELPVISAQQYPPSDMDRRIELRFTPAENTEDLQVLLELGGNGNGISLYLQGDQLHACAWGTRDGRLDLVHQSRPLPRSRKGLEAVLSLHHQKGFRFSLNRRTRAAEELPDLGAHRSPSRLGGVARDTRTHEGILREGQGPFLGVIERLELRLELASRNARRKNATP